MLLNPPDHATTPAPIAAPAPATPLKILTCLHSFDPGGVERVALRLNSMWHDSGADVRLVIGRDSDAAHAGIKALPADLRYEIIPGGEHIDRRTQLVWMLRHLPAIIRRERPDVLFCAGNTYSSVSVGMKLILGRACPPIVAKVSNDLDRRDMGPVLRFFYHRWLRAQAGFIDRYVGMAPAMADEIARATGVGRDRIAIVNDPILRGSELARFAGIHVERADPGVGRHFVAIGRMKPQKNFSLLLRAFARMATPVDRLTILGEGPERPILEALASTLGVADRIAMPGHVSDLTAWLADADVFVMSSDYEGVPAVLIEAIAANLAVVATDCSVSMRDLVGGGAFGQLVPVGDEAALAATMAQAPRSQPDHEAALDHARHFTLEQGAADYLALMRTLVAQTAQR
ncbi:MAG: glycosyltransferase [Sphingomonas sp.]|nr:glycosyltransferase [Sphingomonas sp.]